MSKTFIISKSARILLQFGKKNNPARIIHSHGVLVIRYQ